MSKKEYRVTFSINDRPLMAQDFETYEEALKAGRRWLRTTEGNVEFEITKLA